MKGTGLNGPKRRLNATCSSGERRWPRKNSTWWSRIARRISAMTPSSRSWARSTPPTIAPHAPATGSTVTRRYTWPGAAAATGMRSDDAVVTPSHPRDAAQAVLAGTWAPPSLGQPLHGYDGGTSFAGGSV